MEHVVYQITKKDSPRYYRGVTSMKNWLAGYMGGGDNIITAVAKYGKDAFERTILYVFPNREYADDCEREVVVPNKIDPNSYNIAGGGGTPGVGELHPCYENKEASQKRSIAVKEYNSNPENANDIGLRIEKMKRTKRDPDKSKDRVDCALRGWKTRKETPFNIEITVARRAVSWTKKKAHSYTGTHLEQSMEQEYQQALAKLALLEKQRDEFIFADGNSDKIRE